MTTLEEQKSYVLRCIQDRGITWIVSLAMLSKPTHWAETFETSDTPVIILNPHKKGTLFDLVDTIVHECLHIIYDDLPEDKIVSLTKRIVKQLAPTEITFILTEVFTRAKWSII